MILICQLRIRLIAFLLSIKSANKFIVFHWMISHYDLCCQFLSYRVSQLEF